MLMEFCCQLELSVVRFKESLNFLYLENFGFPSCISVTTAAKELFFYVAWIIFICDCNYHTTPYATGK
jgi:hypothetical protein